MRHLTTIFATLATMACLAIACGAEVTLQGARAQDGAGGDHVTMTTSSSGAPACNCPSPRYVWLATAPCGEVITGDEMRQDRGLIAWVRPDDPEESSRLQVPVLWTPEGVQVECPIWDTTDAELVVEVWGLE